MNLAIVALTLVGAAQAGALWYVTRALRRLHGLETRLGHLADAISLLAETSEAGFRSTAVEIARIAERTAGTSAVESGTTTRRIAKAVKRGRSSKEIAAEERLAEGEVNLRLHLTKAAAARRMRTKSAKEDGHAALRA
jgi:DNA-binding NarL/FixJ family response regulator